MKIFLTELADTNYYNDRLGVVRIKYQSNLYDFKLGTDPIQIPTPKNHYVMIITEEDTLSNNGIDTEEFLPGVTNKTGVVSSLTLGVAFLIDKNQQIKTTNPQNGSSTFNIDGINTFDIEKAYGSIGPRLPKDYTNNEDESEDPNSSNIGIFWTKDVLLIKSRGGSVTLGDEGVHIGGNVFWESSKHSKDIMLDNPLHGIIPQTLPTALVSIPQLPNFAKFIQIADAGQKYLSITKKVVNATKIIADIGSFV